MQYNVLAPVMVKGKSESVPIFQPLLKVNRNVHHQEKLIGRTSELKILTERVEKMRATCEGGAVLLVGPPGGGKSMICAELLRLISSSEKKSTVQVVRTALRDIQRSSAFILIRSLLDQLLHQSTEANGKKKISKEEIISDLLQSNHSDLLSLLPLLNPILALEYPETSDSTSLGGNQEENSTKKKMKEKTFLITFLIFFRGCEERKALVSSRFASSLFCEVCSTYSLCG